MDNDNRFDQTEDFNELMNDVKEATENLDIVIQNMEGKMNSRNENTREGLHASSIDDDFGDILRRKNRNIEDNSEKKTSKKRKLKKWVYLVLVGFVLIVGLLVFWIFHNKKIAADKEKLITEIKSHYGEYVKVDKDTAIYTHTEKDEYKKVGTVYKNAVLKLEEEKTIDEETKYFHVKDSIVSDYYVPYEVVSKSNKQEIDNRYKNYLPFDKALVANNFTLYLNDEKLISFDGEAEIPIIINDYEGKYYVEYNGMLVGIKKEEVKELQDYKIGESKKNQSKITTLAYHRVYDTGDKCTDSYICLKRETFDKQMKYLSDNNYFTLNLEELYMYLNGNLRIEKGVVITLDDGYLYKAADEVLDKYNLNGTMFVISGDFSDYTPFKNLKAIDIQSHTHSLHKNYVCSGGNQGGAILCASKQKIVDDLKKSNEALGVKPIGLAYPFYDYNDNAISALKEVGFKMGFVGRAGALGKATPKVTDLYKIPRMTVWEETIMSYNEWKSYL